MITSPCKNCGNASTPKELCSKNCEIIKKVQQLQVAMVDGPYAAVDCSDSVRYVIRLPITKSIDI